MIDRQCTDMALWLTKDEVADLTGYSRPTCQMRWLKDNGYRFNVSADGTPRVFTSNFGQPAQEEKTVQPNFEGLTKLKKAS